MQHIRIGKEGERLAAQWLQNHGYEIRFRNWRSGRYEIDIVATRRGIFHCIEVKTRRSNKYGYPEQSISRQKFNNIMQAAALFEATQKEKVEVQVDILAISLEKFSVSYFLIPNAGLGYQLQPSNVSPVATLLSSTGNTEKGKSQRQKE